MDLPQTVKLDAADTKALRKAADNANSIQQFIEMVVRTGQERAAKAQEEMREVYKAIALKHGLDLDRVIYKPNEDLTLLVPVQIVLGNAAPTQS